MSVAAQSRDAQIRALRAAGLGYKPIAREVGCAATTVRRVLDPRFAEANRRTSREAKRRRTGICEECGGKTRYNGTDGQGVSRLCADCGSARGGKLRAEATRGKGPRQQELLAYCRVPRRRCEITRALGISPTDPLVDTAYRAGLTRRVSRGIYVAAGSRARGSDA